MKGQEWQMNKLRTTIRNHQWVIAECTVLLLAIVVGVVMWSMYHSTSVGKAYRILVIQSDEKTYKPYDRYAKAFAKALAHEQVTADVKTFYLNCEQYDDDEEIGRLDTLVNSFSKGFYPDLIIVNGDQATYSLLSTRNTKLFNIPIVYGAVRFPNRPLLKEYQHYRNITGLYDHIDIPANLRFIRDISGRGCVITQIDDSFLDRTTMAYADSQLARHPEIRNNLHWQYPLHEMRRTDDNVLSLTSLSLHHAERMASEKDIKSRQIKSKKLGPEAELADRKIQGTQNYFYVMSQYSAGFRFLLLKNERGSRVIAGMANSMLFSAIDENFDMGKDSKVIGGYFTTWETTAKEEAALARRILNENVRPCDISEKVPQKEYVVDWNAHDIKGYDAVYSHLPSYVKLVNIPFREAHRILYLCVLHGSIMLGVFLIVYLYLLYRREQRGKRKAYERMIEERENLNLAILGSRTYAWVITDGKATVSEEFLNTIGLPKKAWSVDFNRGLWFVAPPYREGFMRFLRDQKHEGNFAYQCECDFGNGVLSWWEIRCTTVKTKKGHTKTRGLLIDISDIKKREQELEEARRKAEESERLANEARKLAQEVELKQSFLENMSHQIRTPLNAIVGFSTLIATQHDELSDEDMKSFSVDIEHNTNILLRLVNDVVEMSQIESGDVKFNFREVAVDSLLEEVFHADSFQIPSHLRYELKAGPAHLFVHVDKERLQQVLSHLIANACKFTPKGSITLGWQLTDKNNEVEIYVEDTGIGISEAEQRLVFGRFYKSDEFKPGTGLGLSIAKTIVEHLHGCIKLKSEVGKGSRFSIVLGLIDEKRFMPLQNSF